MQHRALLYDKSGDQHYDTISALHKSLRGSDASLYWVVGSSTHQEYWILAEDLEEFNRNIVGKIEVIAEFHSS